MLHTPFVRNIPPEKLYESDAFRETLGRLCYVADRQMFAVVLQRPSGPVGIGIPVFRGDSKCQLQQQIEIIHGVQHKKGGLHHG